MELHLLSSVPCLKDLRCTLCNKPLSFFPIRTSLKANICGRCSAPNDDSLCHNTAFETISKHVRFPCCYQEQGCEVEYLPSEIPEHEKICTFRGVQCPLSKTGCEWKGLHNDILGHCKEEHNDEILKNGEFDGDGGEKFGLVEHGGFLLIFKRRYDVERKNLVFELYTGESENVARCFSYKIKGVCGLNSIDKSFKTTTFNDVPVPEVLNLESITSGPGGQMIKFYLTIGDGINQDGPNFEMLALLECYLCKNYSLPPIYHCDSTTNTICVDCKSTHCTHCASCQQKNPSRNINLDKMAEKMDYPCKNTKNGCSFVSKPDELKKHHVVCLLITYSCPLQDTCNYEGSYRSLVDHIENDHQELIQNGTVMTKQMVPQRMKYDVVKYANKLFRLVTILTNEKHKKYMWSVQMLGPYQEGFYYEIEIIDPKKQKKMFVRRLCGKLSKISEVFTPNDNYCYFLEDQMMDFITKDVITFKLRIFV